jgi:hypothetical protein
VSVADVTGTGWGEGVEQAANKMLNINIMKLLVFILPLFP